LSATDAVSAAQAEADAARIKAEEARAAFSAVVDSCPFVASTELKDPQLRTIFGTGARVFRSKALHSPFSRRDVSRHNLPKFFIAMLQTLQSLHRDFGIAHRDGV
jgi:hypothetical protein